MSVQGYLIPVLLLFLYLFRSGSVVVNYEVKAGAANFDQIASSNRIIPQFLNPLYQLNQSTFTTKIASKFKALSVFSFDLYFGIPSLNHVAALYC